MRSQYRSMRACSRIGQGFIAAALVALIPLTAVPGCSDRVTEQVPGQETTTEMGTKQPVLRSPFRETDKGLFRIALSIKEPGAKVGTNGADIILKDRHDAHLPGAHISIVPWMPGMDHGVSEKPRVTDRGGGHYGADTLVFNMKGYWELRVRITMNGLEDTVVFSFPDVKEK